MSNRVVLSEQEDQSGVSLEELEHQLKDKVATQILDIFRIANAVMWGFLAIIAFIEFMFIGNGLGDYNTENRLVSSSVVQTLIGATVVQLGVAVVAIVVSLFPRRDQTDSGSG